MSREERLQERLDLEAQKAGTKAPDLDEDGNAINPHIPQYMVKAPWYLGYTEKTLKHHQKRPPKTNDSLDNWYQHRGKTAGPAATKYRKGACTNCGAMTHKVRDCTERPRKIGAKFTGKDIAADEIIEDIELSFDAKRDRWNGVDVQQTQREIREKHHILDAVRQRNLLKQSKEMIMKLVHVSEATLKSAEKVLSKYGIDRENAADPELHTSEIEGNEELSNALKTLLSVIPVQEGGTADHPDIEDILKANDDVKEHVILSKEVSSNLLTNKVNTGGVRDGVEANVTSRSLAIREDVPKYLLNLDRDPATCYFDPKSRSLRGNPFPDKNPEDIDYAGDNFVLASGDTKKVAEMEQFCNDATKHFQDAGIENKFLNMHATPTMAMRAFEKDKQLKKELSEKKERQLLEEYGGGEFLKPLPEDMRSVNESYTEYNQDGSVVSGFTQAVTRSKYVEDQFRNGHTTVWGSFWSAGSWGYKCCESLIKNSICTSKNKSTPTKEISQTKQQQQQQQPDAESKLLLQMRQLEAEMAKRKSTSDTPAVKRSKEDKGSTPKTTPLSGQCDVTEEEMEIYKKTQMRADDPMADFAENN
eukprot:TRINITY_DN1779_c3_g2_i1.p1 TRINITY_DN1779_c3_g2~~TRINITY_DN1779_c3_g2_i1.p1  ORF type:complete len:601 (+),score=143.71 TRINITY_DN1779_c3_g2_i1:40-1803(+)